MKKLPVTLFAVLVLALALGCQPKPEERAISKFSLQQLNARYYYDLGPDYIDITAYSEPQQENYEIFQNVCIQCHTLARSINAPHIAKEDWERHIHRMHARTKSQGWWISFAKDDAAKIGDFLAYDSEIRKVKRAEEFEEITESLKLLFAEVQEEKKKFFQDRNKRSARQPAPYVGVKR